MGSFRGGKKWSKNSPPGTPTTPLSKAILTPLAPREGGLSAISEVFFDEKRGIMSEKTGKNHPKSDPTGYKMQGKANLNLSEPPYTLFLETIWHFNKNLPKITKNDQK